MTKLLEQALEVARNLPPDEQDALARVILGFASGAREERVALTREQRESIAVSWEQARRGEFADEAAVAAVWAKYG